MKSLLFVLSVFTATSLQAVDIRTNDGTIYKGAKITSHTPADVTIVHQSGVAHVAFSNLPVNVQKQFGYDAEKAARYLAAEAEVAKQRPQQTPRIAESTAAQSPVTPLTTATPPETSPTVASPPPVVKPNPRQRQGAPKLKMDKTTYLVKTDKGEGSAFLVRMGSTSYIVTNYHVLKGSKTAEFSNTGDSLTLESSSIVDVATDRDLVRIVVAKDAELVPSEAPSLNQKVDVYGNPGGERVITQETGKLLGIGPVNIEVSAKFILGNSGGPIIQSDTGDVVGVATYLRRHAEMEKWITNKTRFEEARRFGVRLDDSIQWSRTSWSNLCSDTGLIASIDSFVDDAIALARLLATTPYRKSFSSKVVWSNELERMNTCRAYEGVVAAYNGTCNEHAWALDKPIHSRELRQTNEMFFERVRGHASNLGRCLQQASVEFGRVMHHFSTEYTRKEFQDLMSNIGKFGVLLEKSSADIANKNMFQLAPSSSP